MRRAADTPQSKPRVKQPARTAPGRSLISCGWATDPTSASQAHFRMTSLRICSAPGPLRLRKFWIATSCLIRSSAGTAFMSRPMTRVSRFKSFFSDTPTIENSRPWQEVLMSEELRSRVAAQLRRDLAEEMEAGFPLLRRFPNSEMAGMPDFVSRLSTEERESMLDALALYATLQWDHEKFLEKRKNPAIPRLGRPQPRYPDGDWYGGRPKKTALKRAVADKLAAVGFVPRKREKPGSSDWQEFMH